MSGERDDRSDALAESFSSWRPKTRRSLCWPTEPTTTGLCEILARYDLASRCSVLFSPVFGSLDVRQLAEWILADRLPVRFQLQLHKYIWAPDMRGV